MLQAISRAGFDLNAVLGTLVENAARLGRSDTSIVLGVEGGFVRVLAGYGATNEELAYWRELPMPLDGPARLHKRCATGT